MPERTATPSALRFVEDLRAIRQQQGVSLEELRVATRIPLDVLETFEQSVLQENKLFNRVYLRSLVRAYAGAIQVDADRVTDALEQALAGNYGGELLRPPEEAPGAEEPPPTADAATDDAVPAEEAGRVPKPSSQGLPPRAPLQDEGAPRQQAVRPDEPAARDDGISQSPAERPRASRVAPVTTARGPQGSYDDAEPPAPAPQPAPPDWDAVSGSGRRERKPVHDVPWAGILTVAAVVLVLGAGLWWFLSRPPADAVAGEPVAAADTTAVPAAQPPTRPSSMPVTLPDTLTLRVTAKTDSLSDGVQDMKVQVDDDLRRPYWLEKGNSRDFRFVRRITVEQQLDDAELVLEGQALPASVAGADGRVVIDRERARQLLQQR